MSIWLCCEWVCGRANVSATGDHANNSKLNVMPLPTELPLLTRMSLLIWGLHWSLGCVVDAHDVAS